jgi:YfiH family protein
MPLRRRFPRPFHKGSHPKLIRSAPTKVPYFRFPSLTNQKGLIHGIFTRHGGISRAPYDTLNVDDNGGDRPKDVKKNREIIRSTIGADELIFMNQVHGRDIIVLRKEDSSARDRTINADAVITNIPYLGLTVKQADCQAIILFDPYRAVVSIVHCGWRGNVSNILDAVVNRMKTDFQCKESALMAAISPSLGPCCAEFCGYQKIFSEDFNPFMTRNNYFDFWKISCVQLINAGLNKENIETAGICSKCNTDFFYSYRSEKITGRSATVAMLLP